MSNKIDPLTLFNSVYAHLLHATQAIQMIEDVMHKPRTNGEPGEHEEEREEDNE